jgi:hypothetical protein
VSHDLYASNGGLANALLRRFERKRQLEDVDESITLHREVLALCPSPHPDRYKCLGGLANALLARFELTRELGM